MKLTNHENKRFYFWVPRSEVVVLQAILDAYEGLVRIRTERHEADRSLIMCLVQESRASEFLDVMHHLKDEINGQLLSV